MQPQNQKVQPDYNFILNQQTPPPKQTANKKLLVFAGLAVVLAVIAGVGLIFRKTSTSVENTTSLAANQVAVEQFIGFIKGQEYDKAYALLTPSTPVDKDHYKAIYTKFAADFELNKCAIVTSNTTEVEVKCPSVKDPANSITVGFTVADVHSTNRLVSYRTVAYGK